MCQGILYRFKRSFRGSIRALQSRFKGLGLKDSGYESLGFKSLGLKGLGFESLGFEDLELKGSAF